MRARDEHHAPIAELDDDAFARAGCDLVVGHGDLAAVPGRAGVVAKVIE
jgi:hypothetical protein